MTRINLILLFSCFFSIGCSDLPAGQVAGGDPDGADTSITDANGDDGTPVETGVQDPGTGDGEVSNPDANDVDPDAPVEWGCVPDSGETEICDNQYDDDCDGLVDEVCGCTPPESIQGCYPGNPAHLTVTNGRCQSGTQICGLEFWSRCDGAIGPIPEVCDDDIDNNCDGEIDEECGGEPPIAVCPADATGPVLSHHSIRGEYHDENGEPMTRATWFYDSPDGHSAGLTYDDDGLGVGFFADVAGDYRFVLTVFNQYGSDSCETVFTATTADVIRVEMYWNPTWEDGDAGIDCSDIDLYLHREPAAEDTWRYFRQSGTESDIANNICWPNPSVCNWQDCATCDEPYGSSGAGNDRVRERNCRQELTEAAEACGPSEICPAPLDDANWSECSPARRCGEIPECSIEIEGVTTMTNDDDDPRLDLDDVEGHGPENINVRKPNAGIFRVGVHAWSGDYDRGRNCHDFTTSQVFVRVLCGGVTVYDTAEDDPSGVPMVANDDNRFNGHFWEVGELSVSYDGEGRPVCSFTKFGSPGCPLMCLMGQSDGGCSEAEARGVVGATCYPE